MKRFITTSIICILAIIGFKSHAQQLGVIGGINLGMNTIKVDGVKPMTSEMATWQAGAIVSYDITDRIEINGSLIFIKKGAKLPSSAGNNYLRLSYIEMPINIGYSFPLANTKSSFFVEGGPYFAYALHGSYYGQSITFGGRDREFNNYDIGIGAGIGWKFAPFKAKIGYEYGFTKLPNISGTNIHNQLISLTLACFIDFRN